MAVEKEKSNVLAFGIGFPTKTKTGKIIEVYYAYLSFQPDQSAVDALLRVVSYPGGNACVRIHSDGVKSLVDEFKKLKKAECARRFEAISESRRDMIVYILADDTPPTTTEELYLKLSLISHKFIRPLTLNFDNVFNLLPNVAWTSEGAMDLDEARERQLDARIKGEHFHVFAVDKFPKMLDYCLPDQVRVADTARVRLGAYLGPGTTVMQTGLVNFNSGTEGPNMVEGRISVGVFVGGNSDLGGGSSTMSSTYRDNRAYNSIGRNSVIGANGGSGITLGDECSIEAGLYVTAGTKVELLDRTHQRIGMVKARDLAGRSNLLFRRNSSTGQVEALESEPTVELNKVLHENK